MLEYITIVKDGNLHVLLGFLVWQTSEIRISLGG